jgi:tetratricopeptide (TPR) repeat protein
VGALPKPRVPDGPIRTLFDELHELHHRAGWPSLREIAKEVGCSHTTISVALCEPRVPKWGVLELIIEALGGDTLRFHALWMAASRTGHTPPVPASEARLGGLAVPRDLPPDVSAFTGRAHQLTILDGLLEGAGAAPAVVIGAVSGTAGVGKTALAVHWAHRVTHRFPDGQLYVDLRGYDPDKPVQPAQALEAFLRELGVAGSAIPTEVAERTARYRTLVAGRRMLVLLDNARSVDQVRDLLPGTPSCFVVITSRDMLPALVARHGAVRINLDLLPLDEALALLRRLIGARADTAPGAVTLLAQRCARLPLALRIAAEIAVARPTATLAELVAELGDETRLLDLLDAGQDEHTAVRAVFSWSYRNLTPETAGAFKLVGLHPGRTIDSAAIAALIGTDRGMAQRILEALSRAHLIEPTGAGWYMMHDLLRAYAVERAAECGDDECRRALDRLFDYYVDATRAAVDAAFKPVLTVSGHAVNPDDPAAVDVRAAGRAWLDQERLNIVAVAAAAAARRPTHTCRLSLVIGRYLDSRAHFLDALDVHRYAVNAARSAGDRASEGNVLNLLGVVHRRLGRYPEALYHHEHALAIHREIGNRAGVADSLRGLGILHWRLGHYEQAREHLDEALATFSELGDHAGMGSVLHNLGVAYRRLGRYPEALAHYQRSLTIYREIGDPTGEGRTLNNVGIVYLLLGRHTEAVSNYERSLAIHRDTADRTNEAVALTNLGLTYERLGRYEQARLYHEQALAIYIEAGYRVGEGDASHGLGVTHHRLGNANTAVEYLRQAVAVGREIGEADIETKGLIDLANVLRDIGRLDDADETYQLALPLAGNTGDRYEQARALDGIARLRQAQGDLSDARQHWLRALDLYTDLGVPEAEAVQDCLDTTGIDRRTSMKLSSGPAGGGTPG